MFNYLHFQTLHSRRQNLDACFLLTSSRTKFHALTMQIRDFPTFNVNSVSRLGSSKRCVTAANNICQSLDAFSKYNTSPEDTYSFTILLSSDELWAGRPGFNSWPCKIFLFSTASRPTLGPKQPPIHCVPGALSPGVKRQGRDVDHSHPSSAEIKKCGAIPPLPPMSSWHSALLIECRDNFTFPLKRDD
jgi:hypothetical protein